MIYIDIFLSSDCLSVSIYFFPLCESCENTNVYPNYDDFCFWETRKCEKSVDWCFSLAACFLSFFSQPKDKNREL